MTKFNFLSVLEGEMDKYFTFGYIIDQNKRNRAVEMVFISEVQDQSATETVDDQSEISNGDIIFEDYALFYGQAKSKVDEDSYLVTIPFDAKKDLSREFLAYFTETLNDVAARGLDDLMGFLADENVTDFVLEWDTEGFENGKVRLKETEYFAYPRY